MDLPIPTRITPTAETVLATSGLVRSHPDPSKILCFCQLPLPCIKTYLEVQKGNCEARLGMETTQLFPKSSSRERDRSQHSTGVSQYTRGT